MSTNLGSRKFILKKNGLYEPSPQGFRFIAPWIRCVGRGVRADGGANAVVAERLSDCVRVVAFVGERIAGVRLGTHGHDFVACAGRRLAGRKLRHWPIAQGLRMVGER